MATRGLAYSQYTAWGSEPSTYTSLPITDYSFNVNRNLIAEKAMNVAGEPKIYGGTYGASGSLSAAYRPSEFATIIAHGILSKTSWSSGTASGIGDFAEASSGYKNFYNICAGDEFGNVITFASCAFTSCELSLRAGEMGKISFNWVGVKKAASDGTISTPSYAGDIPIFYNAVLKVGAADTLIKVTGITLKINRPLSSDDYVIGSEYTQSIIQSDSCTVEGTLNLSNKEFALLQSAITTGDEANWDDLDELKTNTVNLGKLSIQFNNPAGTGDNLGGLYITKMMLNTTDVSVNGRQKFDKTINFRCETTSTSGISWNFTGTAPTS